MSSRPLEHETKAKEQWKAVIKKVKKQEEELLKQKLNETMDQLKKMDDDLESQKRECADSNFRLTKTHDFLVTQTSAFQENMQTLLDEISKLEERCSDLRLQLEKQKQELEHGQEENDDKKALHDLIDKLREKLTESNDVKDEYKEQLDSKTNELKKKSF